MKGKFFLLLLFFLFIGFAAILLFWWKWAISPVDSKRTSELKEVFVINRGESTDQIVRRLYFEDLIRSPLAFKLFLKKENLAGRLQAGDFYLSPNMDARQITQVLAHGTLDVWVTIPEGLRSEEIFQIIKKENFDFDFYDWQRQTGDKEGFLFPDTYLFPKQASPSMVLKIMEDNFDQKVKALDEKVSKRDVILASLIEREAKYDEDRAIVGGILLKRLENEWPLEVDAVIQYAKANVECRVSSVECDNWWPQVSGKDLEIDSAYNSYKNKGLPPAPICNPGLSSIKAALFPKKSDFWFYLSDREGEMHYAKTIEEHEENIEKYL